jgi:3-hydroxybutyryl-CoA dehydratase
MSTFTKTVHITKKMVAKFGDAVHDHNPIHFDERYAATTAFGRPIAHGALLGGLISGMLVESYGQGTIYVSTSLKFIRPIYVGTFVRLHLATAEETRWTNVQVAVIDDQEQVAITGLAQIVPGKEFATKENV